MTRHTTLHAIFEVSTLPGNPQVAVTHSFFVRPECRGKGWGKVAKQEQNSLLRSLGYDYAICTVREDNKAQKSILKSSGWRFQSQFFDQRQLTMVEMWGYSVS